MSIKAIGIDKQTREFLTSELVLVMQLVDFTGWYS
jgi:hypothetical protein